ncbi:interleukin-6 receptor subunit beta isoform X2 [Notolabrus celidotus]|nr:interleukin-6 receptor subunit beta isoform X2 [Notolabrus celidotus]
MSPWSLWSNEAQGGTAEDAPSDAPAFWRQVKQTDMNGWRRTSLLWQPLPLSLANGRVLFYNVTCETESSHVLNDPGSCRDLDHASTSCSLLLPAGRCSCSLTASTSGGTSPEAQIWLLGASDAETPSMSNLSASPLDDSRLDVRWTAPADWPSSGYVVEWFAVRDKNSSILHWKRLNSSCTALVITEGVQPLERFAVSVRALYGERGAGQNKTIYIYTLQGAPSAGPLVEVKQISGSSVKLTWTAVPVELLHGFLRNYTLYFKTATQPAKSVSVPAQANSYSLRNLSPGSYDIFMQANTDPGAGIVGPITNVHIGSDEVSLVVWAVLSLILTSLVLVAVACLAQTKMVKKKLFQDVPNPSQSSLANWTPKPALEGMKWPADKIQMKYSEVVLLGESKLLNSDHDKEDLTYKSLCNLQTYSLNGYNHFPVSGAQTCNKSSAKAKTSSDSDLSAIYSDVLTSQIPQSLQKPLLTLSHLQYDWQHSIISVSDVELQPEGDSDLDASLQSRAATDSESPLSQTYALKVLCHTQSQSSDSSSVSLSSVFISPPAEVKSPQHLFLKKIYNSVPTLQSDTFTHPDNLCGTMSAMPFPRSMFVDFSYSPVGYDDPYVCPAV